MAAAADWLRRMQKSLSGHWREDHLFSLSASAEDVRCGSERDCRLRPRDPTLAPHKPTSGGKALKKKKRGSASTRVAGALRMAATSLEHSPTALGAYYRHTARRKGGSVAVFATARKLATLVYRLLRWGQPYIDEGAAAYEKRYQESRIKRLTATAKQLGYQLMPKASQA